MPDMTWAPYMGQFFGNIAQSLSGNNPGLSGAAGSVAGQGAQMAENMEYQRMLEEQEKAKKKAKKGKLLGTLGSIAGAAIPGVGPLVSAGLSAAGGTIGQSVGEGEFIGLDRMLSEQALPSAAGYGLSKLGGAMGAGKFGPATYDAALKPTNFAARIGSGLSNPMVNQFLGRTILDDESDMTSLFPLLALHLAGGL